MRELDNMLFPVAILDPNRVPLNQYNSINHVACWIVSITDSCYFVIFLYCLIFFIYYYPSFWEVRILSIVNKTQLLNGSLEERTIMLKFRNIKIFAFNKIFYEYNKIISIVHTYITIRFLRK